MLNRQGWCRHGGPVARGALVALALGTGVGANAGTYGHRSDGLSTPAAMAIPMSASTAACGARSPSLERLGSRYLDLGDAAPTAIGSLSALAPLIADRRDPRRAKALRLAHLVERLHGATFDGGRGERTRCHGIGERRRGITWRFDLEQLERAKTLDGRTALTAFESRHTVLVDSRDDRRVDGTSSAAVIDLPSAGDWRAGEDGSTLRANRRFRRAGSTCALVRPAASAALSLVGDARAPRCSLVTEIDMTARALDGSIELEQVLYVDGLWSERVVWRLDS